MSFQALYALALWLITFLAPGHSFPSAKPHAHSAIRTGVGIGNPKLFNSGNGLGGHSPIPPNASR